MIKFSPLPSAPPEYLRDAESLFRRSVENSLLEIYSGLESAVTAQSGEASPASKRETLLLLQKPLGLETKSTLSYPVDGTNSTSPSVQGYSQLVLSPSGSPLVVDRFYGGQDGQTVTIFSFQVTGLTLEHGASGDGSMALAGGVDLVFGTTSGSWYSNVTLVKLGLSWKEISRTILS
ncbi:MAG: hypothetical protein CME21_21390 [Gemmatimonadetes bacterium]|nr:hypothetical protein [Gemmatimonadota bacterium]